MRTPSTPSTPPPPLPPLPLLLLLLLPCVVAIPAARPQYQVLVNTTTGSLQGFVEQGSRKWLGVPYAEPPVGDRRWRPPARWRRNIRAMRPITLPAAAHTNSDTISICHLSVKKQFMCKAGPIIFMYIHENEYT